MIRPSYRDRLEQFEMTQLAGARFLGVGARTSREWARPGAVDEGAPQAVMMLFALMHYCGLGPDEVETIWSEALDPR